MTTVHRDRTDTGDTHAASPLAAASFTIVGATGAVGRELLSILESRGVPAARLRALASARSAGDSIAYAGTALMIGCTDAAAFADDAATRSSHGDRCSSLSGGGLSFTIFAADAETSRTFAPLALSRGCWVIDNSSAFRMNADVPLIVPEVNAGELDRDRCRSRLIANPNCCVAILAAALQPLRAAWGIDAVDVVTYQAVSGAGAPAIDELVTQTRRVLDGGTPQPSVFSEPCAFNLFSHNSAMDESTGLNDEERKIIDETRKIWGDPDVAVTPTCVRVPVVRAHTLAITLTLRAPADEADVRRSFADVPGLTLIDDRAANTFPTPLKAAGRDEVLIGRVRAAPCEASRHRARRFCLLACGDQLRKGAALNAVQIAELIARDRT
jgi:aspartate-semialdehyde dehydrogenase